MILVENNINYKINIDRLGDKVYNKITRSNTKIFTFRDYLRYQEFVKKKIKDNLVSVGDKLQDKNEEYFVINSKKKEINNEDDKLIRKMLDVKKEAAEFINSIIHINIKPEQLEKYNRSFVTLNLENRESDVIYKLVGKNIFFLIEHQTKIDNSIQFRIMEYSAEIIKSSIDYSKLKQKDYKLPLVVPIVLYTGKRK